LPPPSDLWLASQKAAIQVAHSRAKNNGMEHRRQGFCAQYYSPQPGSFSSSARENWLLSFKIIVATLTSFQLLLNSTYSSVVNIQTISLARVKLSLALMKALSRQLVGWRWRRTRKQITNKSSYFSIWRKSLLIFKITIICWGMW
jgi:hypothetical protein